MDSPLYRFVAEHYDTDKGICSVCSSHVGVLESAMARAVTNETVLLVESTANQVDQFGGYTGMTPQAFRAHVLHMAAQAGLPKGRLLLGGDHLGPLSWRNEPVAAAMDKAEALVRAYAGSGFTKIHLDCSMACADDPGPAPAPEECAKRAARLCRAAEESAGQAGLPPPVYVIGTEVPIPGGATHDLGESVVVTTVDDARQTLELHRRAFAAGGLEAAFERVMGLVVQPGVEFDHASVVGYRPELAENLSRFASDNGHFVFEAHSTDYQTPLALDELVRDHFAILKVGPWLTWAWRQGLFALEHIESELVPADRRSGLSAAMEAVMLADDRHWKSHYLGTTEEQRLARRFSYSDRVRYYWSADSLKQAEHRLQANLEATGIPLPLLSQYLPLHYELVRAGRLHNAPRDLLLESVGQVLDIYAAACGDGVRCRRTA